MTMHGYAAVALGLALSSTAWADWTITNQDQASYEVKTQCGHATEEWWISGGVTKPNSVPEGNSCRVMLKKGGSSCLVRDRQACVIKRGKIFRAGRAKI